MNKLYLAFSATFEYKIQRTKNKIIKYKSKNKNTKCRQRERERDVLLLISLLSIRIRIRDATTTVSIAFALSRDYSRRATAKRVVSANESARELRRE